ncbi:MAG: Rne/Rng family ribonuclease [Pseudomonadota bacterium]
MAQRMLIDATRQGETRVVVVNGNRVEEFDYETATKHQLKGNIYLAKVTRVEPSLQAAFVEYGGNRHGFLPFSEIHPDYYRIPIADREKLLAEEAEQRAQESQSEGNGEDHDDGGTRQSTPSNGRDEEDDEPGGDSSVEEIATENSVDTVGGDEDDEVERRRIQLLRRYKIQEVIKRRQVMLVQVTKEERGNKGAALTTYLSLAGRYCVLMPNTAKGGGISRKISNAADRKRLKSVVSELDIPDGMAVIVRTAGSQRNKTEIRRDYEYLLRLWDDIRNTTLSSTAPCLIHEEANLIKRAIRDVYTRDMENILVEGEEGYKSAKAFMKMLMPSHARRVTHYNDPSAPLFHRHQVEEQLEAMYSHTVQLKSGGSIVINPTEALVSIDVNSGRSTRERHIEETALKTNVEAADEVARQLRLRDLAGLVVIDFIDMEDSKHNREVERRLKEAMRNDRARIQLGRISPFGLLELSRQRLRPSLFETVNIACPVCRGTGHLRSPDAVSSTLLRAVTDEAVRRGGGKVEVRLPVEVMMTLFNDKREDLRRVEERFDLQVVVQTDSELGPQDFSLQRLSYDSSKAPGEATQAEDQSEADSEETASASEDEDRRQQSDEEGNRRRRGRRGGRRRRGQGDDKESTESTESQSAADSEDGDEEDTSSTEAGSTEARGGEDEETEEQKSRRRRRGRRGGRRRRGRRDGEDSQQAESRESEGESSADSAEGDGDAAPQQPSDEQSAEVSADPQDSSGQESAEQAVENAEEKPKPRRRTRRSRKPDAEAAAVEAGAGDSASADVGEEAAGSAEGEAQQEEAAPAKPRRSRRRKAAEPTEETPAEGEATEDAPKKRTRRTRKKSEPTESAEDTATAEAASAGDADAVAQDSETDEKPVKKASSRRRTSTRKSAAKKAQDESAAEINAADESGTGADVAASGNGQTQPVTEQASEPAQTESATRENGHGQDTSKDLPETGETAAGDESAQPQQQKRPRKRGWWNRLLE